MNSSSCARYVAILETRSKWAYEGAEPEILESCSLTISFNSSMLTDTKSKQIIKQINDYSFLTFIKPCYLIKPHRIQDVAMTTPLWWLSETIPI